MATQLTIGDAEAIATVRKTGGSPQLVRVMLESRSAAHNRPAPSPPLDAQAVLDAEAASRAANPDANEYGMILVVCAVCQCEHYICPEYRNERHVCWPCQREVPGRIGNRNQ